jgi:hypothetical protein
LQFPVVIEQVIMRALSKNPRDRYSDVLLFAKALAAALTASQGDAVDGGFMSRMKGFFRSKGAPS